MSKKVISFKIDEIIPDIRALAYRILNDDDKQIEVICEGCFNIERPHNFANITGIHKADTLKCDRCGQIISEPDEYWKNWKKEQLEKDAKK